ncbi:MAG: hypothetical protein ACKN9D_03530, partial [Actinomycetales bacterium]
MPHERLSERPAAIRRRLREIDEDSRGAPVGDDTEREHGAHDSRHQYEVDDLLSELHALRVAGIARGSIDRSLAGQLYLHELATAGRLRDLGHVIVFRTPRPGDTADCLLDGLRW